VNTVAPYIMGGLSQRVNQCSIAALTSFAELLGAVPSSSVPDYRLRMTSLDAEFWPRLDGAKPVATRSVDHPTSPPGFHSKEQEKIMAKE
jgi:hypothetical protein